MKNSFASVLVFTLLLCALSARADSQSIRFERVGKVEAGAEMARWLRSDRHFSRLLMVQGTNVRARPGIATLFRNRAGSVLVVGSAVNNATVTVNRAKGGDSHVFFVDGVYWASWDCECKGTTDEECSLRRTETGDLVLNSEGDPICEGDSCCKLYLRGIDGGLNTYEHAYP